VRALVGHGQRAEFVAALTARYGRETGRPAQVSGDVEKVRGRPARSFGEWVADHAGLCEGLGHDRAARGRRLVRAPG
jgi:hypothetical protein